MVRCGRPHKAKVEGQRSIEQDGVTRQITDVLSQILELNVSDIYGSDANRTGISVVESCNEFCKCALSGAVLPSDGNLFARQDLKRGDMKHFLLPSISKPDLGKINLGRMPSRETNRSRGIRHAWR